MASRTSFFRTLGTHIDAFWFRPISAVGFGAMRIGFAFTALLGLLLQWNLVQFFYGPVGVLPRSMVAIALRHSYRFSLLDYVGATGTAALYGLLIASLLLVLLGIWTRASLIMSVVLLYSFHEYAQITLDGGDTLLRLLGLLLIVSPCHRALSIHNLRRRWRLARDGGHEQPPSERRMAIWPYRLLLWQMICLYGASAIEKWSGTTWPTGSAVAIALHHDHFSRVPALLQDMFTYVSPAISLFVLLSQTAWFLLILLPLLFWAGVIHERVSPAVKRFLLLCGVIVHGLIFVLLDVGVFSLVVFSAYLGLLIDEDWKVIGTWCAAGKRRKMSIVLFDGRCGVCQRSIVLLQSMDWLRRLSLVNYHDPAVRKLYVPSVPLKTLDAALHVKSPTGSLSSGFGAFRKLATILPPLWPLVPFLWLPGIPWLGSHVYGFVASRRRRRSA